MTFNRNLITSFTYMGRALIILICLVLPLSSLATEFCVQSLNLYGPAYAPNVNLRSELFSKYLQKEGACEVVALQEVWRAGHSKKLTDLFLQALPNYAYYGRIQNQVDGATTGLSLLHRLKVHESGTELFGLNFSGPADWVRNQLGLHKGFSAYVFETSSGEFFVFLNTHLHHSSQALRITQVIDLGRFLMANEIMDWPVILVGDFNFEPGSLEWLLMTEVYGMIEAFNSRHPGSESCTYCAQNPMSLTISDRRIDHVFFRSGVRHNLELRSVEIDIRQYRNWEFSDHYGLTASFEIGSQKDPASHFLRAVSLQHPLNHSKSVIEMSLHVLEDENDSDFDYYIEELKRLKSLNGLSSYP